MNSEVLGVIADSAVESSVGDIPLRQRRFGGIERLYGSEGLDRLLSSHICVIGIGGVGSWVAEALARTAVGELTLIDLDVVAESNINRQLVALDSQLGRDKTAVMCERIADINPNCRVHQIDDFITTANAAELLGDQFDYVVDCVDDFRVKAAIVDHCKRHKMKLVTVGGAGGQIDPSKIVRADLSKTEHDVLLARTRKLLRQDYGFPKNLKRSFGIATVYSKEQLRFPDGEGGLSSSKPTAGDVEGSLNGLNCAGGLGSVTHVTAAFGMLAASVAINDLVQR
ncbi:MAG: tRNA threonylcarbamoyladenosine dehydratase [Pseudomonadota bacterium]